MWPGILAHVLDVLPNVLQGIAIDIGGWDGVLDGSYSHLFVSK